MTEGRSKMPPMWTLQFIFQHSICNAMFTAFCNFSTELFMVLNYYRFVCSSSQASTVTMSDLSTGKWTAWIIMRFQIRRLWLLKIRSRRIQSDLIPIDKIWSFVSVVSTTQTLNAAVKDWLGQTSARLCFKISCSSHYWQSMLHNILNAPRINIPVSTVTNHRIIN